MTTRGTTRPAAVDWWATLFAGWLVAGLALDLWAHHHLASTLETFFTPWHGVLYSGFAAGALWLLARQLRGGLPRGYGLSLVGVAVFAAGGVFDGLWHALFGIELDIEAGVSPSHLVLAAGGVLILSGPLRAAWLRPADRPSLMAMLPAALSAAFTLALALSLTEYANAFSHPWPAAAQREPDTFFGAVPEAVAQTLGIVSVIVQSSLLAAFALALAARWRTPRGTFVVVFTVATTLTSFSHDHYEFIAVAFAGGVVADVLAGRLSPTLDRPATFRLYAFVVPASVFAAYFIAIAATGTIWWSVHLVTGAVVLAGAAGLGLAQLVLSLSLPAYARPADRGR